MLNALHWLFACVLQEQNLNGDWVRAEGRVVHTPYNPWVVI